MPPPKLAPSLSFKRISPSAFIHQVIGDSELSTVHLPTATQLQPGINHHLRLLLRLKWILQALSHTIPAERGKDLAQSLLNLNGDVLLRVLTYVCDVSGSVRPQRDAHSEYAVLRRVTLQFLTCAVHLLVRLKTSWTREEMDWVRDQIQETVQGWSRHVPVSLVEASIIKEVLALVSTAPSSSGKDGVAGTPVSTSSDPATINVAFDHLLGLDLLPSGDQARSFWTIHDWLLTMECERRDTHEADVTLAVYREALSKLRARPDHHYSFPLATYMFEELAVHTASMHQLLSHEEIVPDNQMLSHMLQVLGSEAAAFSGSFPEYVTVVEARQEAAPPVPALPSPAPFPTPRSPPTSPSRSANPSPITHSGMPSRKLLANVDDISVPPPAQTRMQPPRPQPVSRITVPATAAEVRASHSSADPVELPTRRPTHRPQSPSVPSIQIDSGLEVVEEPNFDSSSDFEKMMMKPQLGLRPLSFYQGGDTRSISGISSIGSVSSRSRSRLFSRFGGSKKHTVSPLPASLEFCFSNCAQQAIFWCKKNPDSLVRVQHPFQQGERFEMLIPNALAPSPNKPQSRSIRLLAAATNAVVALVHIEESRWLYVLRDDAFQPLIALPDSTPAILSLCLSHHGNKIALGCGHFVLIYTLLNGRLSGPSRLDPLASLGSRVVRLQRMNFSTDSRRLISAVQVEHNTHKHAVFVSIWSVTEPKYRLEAQLDPVYLTVGYSDDTGITSIFLAGQSDSLTVQQAFLTAALSKSYPSILPIAPGMRNQHLDISDKRIDGAIQCASPLSPHLCAIRSGRNKMFVVDVRTGTMEKLADFSAERKSLHLRHEHVALGMQGPDRVRALWRTADEGLVLKTMARGADGRWGVKTMELGAIYRQAAGLV